IRGQIGRQVVNVFTGLGKESLTTFHLGFQRTQGTVGQLLIKVRDRTDGVWQPFGGFERGTTFEVNKNKTQRFGAVARSQPGNKGAQEFGFTGTGGPTDQPVRAVLDDV